VYEIMKMTDTIRRLTMQRVDAATIAQAAATEGYHTMRDDAAYKISLGMTDEAEAFRVLH
jgi:type II secretory ATPase GspE/PulE/Tfp pilus assembly ATPase PilB-like protein